jgi:hypothetical protein
VTVWGPQVGEAVCYHHLEEVDLLETETNYVRSKLYYHSQEKKLISSEHFIKICKIFFTHAGIEMTQQWFYQHEFLKPQELTLGSLVKKKRKT